MEAFKRGFSAQDGFTLIEMMVVLTIIAILLGIGIRAYIGYIGKSKTERAMGDFAKIQGALEAYYSQNALYPNPNNPSAIAAAGLNVDLITTSGDTTDAAPYRYKVTSVTSYEIYTFAPVDGINYVVATGADGVPYDPALAANY